MALCHCVCVCVRAMYAYAVVALLHFIWCCLLIVSHYLMIAAKWINENRSSSRLRSSYVFSKLPTTFQMHLHIRLTRESRHCTSVQCRMLASPLPRRTTVWREKSKNVFNRRITITLFSALIPCLYLNFPIAEALVTFNSHTHTMCEQRMNARN